VLDFDVLSWAVGALILLIVLPFLWKRNRSFPFLVCFSVFWVYALLVVKVTLFPIPVNSTTIEILREERPFMSFVNLIPGNLDYLGAVQVRELLYNVLLALPFGFGLSFLTRLTWKKVLFAALAFGLVVEGMQLIISLVLGFPYRSIDINDLLLNAVGVVLGYALFLAFAWIYRCVDRRLPGDSGAFTSFARQVADRPTRSTGESI
jgi:glycopeptide antibiotics resistance protein